MRHVGRLYERDVFESDLTGQLGFRHRAFGKREEILYTDADEMLPRSTGNGVGCEEVRF